MDETDSLTREAIESLVKDGILEIVGHNEEGEAANVPFIKNEHWRGAHPWTWVGVGPDHSQRACRGPSARRPGFVGRSHPAGHRAPRQGRPSRHFRDKGLDPRTYAGAPSGQSGIQP